MSKDRHLRKQTTFRLSDSSKNFLELISKKYGINSISYMVDNVILAIQFGEKIISDPKIGHLMKDIQKSGVLGMAGVIFKEDSHQSFVDSSTIKALDEYIYSIYTDTIISDMCARQCYTIPMYIAIPVSATPNSNSRIDWEESIQRNFYMEHHLVVKKSDVFNSMCRVMTELEKNGELKKRFEDITRAEIESNIKKREEMYDD